METIFPIQSQAQKEGFVEFSKAEGGNSRRVCLFQLPFFGNANGNTIAYHKN